MFYLLLLLLSLVVGFSFLLSASSTVGMVVIIGHLDYCKLWEGDVHPPQANKSPTSWHGGQLDNKLDLKIKMMDQDSLQGGMHTTVPITVKGCPPHPSEV